MPWYSRVLLPKPYTADQLLWMLAEALVAKRGR